MAQALLFSLGAQYVTVFHMFVLPRNNVGSYPCCGGFTTDTERDAVMTSASDSDLAWVRPGKEQSGTARNLARRQRIKQKI